MRDIEELVDNCIMILKNDEGYKFDEPLHLKKIILHTEKKLSSLDKDYSSDDISILDVESWAKDEGYIVVKKEAFDHILHASNELSGAISEQNK